MPQTVAGESAPARVVELEPVLTLACGHFVRVKRPTRAQQEVQERQDNQCPSCKESVTIQAAPHGREWRVLG